MAKFALAGAPLQLWFLAMLFAEFALFELLWRLLGERFVSRLAPMLALMAALYCAGTLLPVDVGQVAAALRYAPVFWLGMAFRARPTERFWAMPAPLIMAAQLALFAATLLASSREGLVWSSASIALWPMVRIAGVAMVVSIAGRLLDGGRLALACFAFSLAVSVGMTALLRRFRVTRFLIGG